MAGFDGNGSWTRAYSWAADAANGIKISSTRMDGEWVYIAGGFNNCLTRDGQGKPTGPIDWNGQNLSGVNTLTATSLVLNGAAASLIDFTSEVLITGTTTLGASSIGVAHLVQGTTANYTVTLPAAAVTGQLVVLRIDPQATKLFTIDGNTRNIDGAPQRVMWAGEEAWLRYSISGQWEKIFGRTRPMNGVIRKSATQTVASGPWVKCLLDATAADLSGLNFCFDSANNRFIAPRRGNWGMSATVSFNSTAATVAGDCRIGLSRNGSGTPTSAPSSVIIQPYIVGQLRSILTTSWNSSFAAGDYVELLGQYTFTAASAGFEFITGLIEPTLNYWEIPEW